MYIIHADLCENTPAHMLDWYALVDENRGGVVAYFSPHAAEQFHHLVEAAKRAGMPEANPYLDPEE